MMMSYGEQDTLRQARAAYFAANRFGEGGGYDARWVELKAGPMVFYLRNSPSRVRAVRLHDLHHVATGYQTDWRGEFEISAWEIGGGCGAYGFAWFINLGGLAGGLFLCPRRVYQAFLRGRHSRTLYGEGFRDELLDETVGSLRRRLRLDGPPAPATVADRLAFLGFALVSMPVSLLQLLGGFFAGPLGQWNKRSMQREQGH
jgi:hypothetical protein